VVSAEIRSNPHPLGALLLRTGKIAERPRARARHAAASGGQAPARRDLVSLGVITQREVERQVRFQIEESSSSDELERRYFSFAEEAESKVPTK